MSRKAISKKTRFEVFKRDAFRCQYCGEAAPDVVLHIDHIKPVKEGGDNDLTNLITSCSNCNLGKSARELDDKSVVHKQKKQLDELNERRQQLEMMMEWRRGLLDIDEEKFSYAKDQFCEAACCGITEAGANSFRKILKKFPYDLVLESIDAAVSQYLVPASNGDFTEGSKVKAFEMIGRICAVKKRQRENPGLADVYYAKGILKNRFYWWQPSTLASVARDMENIVRKGGSPEVAKRIAKEAENYQELYELLNAWEREIE